MHVGTPVSLEEAISYVYGKESKINSSNVAALLDIAEFLIIPGLKAKCVIWIKSAKITDENCLDMIKLASLYEFSLLSYEEYLKGRLPDLVQMDEMMDLTVDSVEYILTRVDLSSVKASDKSVFEDFLYHIYFADMERRFVTDVVKNVTLIRKLGASSSFTEQLESLKTLRFCEILLFLDQYSYNQLPCYDMSRRRWCSLNINSVDERPKRFYNFGNIENDVTNTVSFLSWKGTVPHVCAKYNRNDSSLETIDLKANAIRLESSDKIAQAGDGFVIYNNTHCISIAKQNGPSVLNNYLINEYKWWPTKLGDNNLHKYLFCENRWYHYYEPRDSQKLPVFEFTTHEKLIVAVKDQGGITEEIWEDLARQGEYEDPGTQIVRIKVSKERLSCAFNCSHCKLQRAPERENYLDDISQWPYDSDSDY